MNNNSSQSTNTNILQGQTNPSLNSNINNINESKNSKSQQDTLYQLCQALLRFINRKIVKKYIFPNEAQLPKEKRGLELRANNIWKYYLNNDVTEEEKIKDVFKDDKFLLSLQKMTNSLNEVTGLIESNQKKMKMMEEKSKNKEEKINALSEINDLLSSFFKNKEKGENSNNSNKNEDIIIDNILEKMKGFYSLQKYHEDSNENKNNENGNKIDESHSMINNSELNNTNNELDLLINNFGLDELKEHDKDNNKEIKDDNIFLNKKTEREDNKSKTNKTKNKNKKKKNKIKSENKENNINNKDEQESPSQKEKEKEKINLPILKPKEEKKEDDIDEEIIKQILENELEENSNANDKSQEKKQIINLDLLSKDARKELFDIELRKKFTGNKRPKKENNIIKEIRNILNALEDKKIQEMKNYNERISGPYLCGSFKVFRNLCAINYSREIDLVFKYKDMLLNQDIINYSVKEVLENYLKLNIVKSTEIKEKEVDEENKVVKIDVECTSKKLDKNDIIKFNVLFMDSGIGFNEKIIDELILNKKEFLVKTEEEKFTNISLFLRIWRRREHLFYLIPEMLDELTRKFLKPEKSMLNVILNVIYEIYNQFINLYPKDSNSFVPASKILCEDILKDLFRKDNEKRIKDLKEKIVKLANDMREQKYENVFQI